MRGSISLKHLVTAAAFALALTVFSFGQSCPGEPGCLDGSFDSDGVLQVSIPNSMRGMVRKIAVASDGSIVALFENLELDNVNRPIMARFFTDGTLDAGFGNGGFVYLNWPSGTGGPRNIAVQSDGRVVVSGYSQLGRNALALRVQRFNYNGTPDDSFDSDGVASINVTGGVTLKLLPDGKILIMNHEGKLIRLQANGSLDSTFGSGGIASPKLALAPAADGLVVLPSGRIIGVGHTIVSGLYRFTVVGYNSNGTLDDGAKGDPTPSDQFGSKGSVVLSFPGYSDGRGYVLKVDSNGKLVAMGAAGTQNTTVAVVRLTSNGQLDTSFAGTGKLVFSRTNGAAQGSALGLQSDGRIVVIGGFFYPDLREHDAMVLRFTEQGVLDMFALNDPFGLDEACMDGAVVTGDRILWAGMIASEPGTVRIPLMMRFLP